LPRSSRRPISSSCTKAIRRTRRRGLTRIGKTFRLNDKKGWKSTIKETKIGNIKQTYNLGNQKNNSKMATKEIIRSINQMSKNKPKSSKKMKQFSSRPLKFQKKTLISCDNYASYNPNRDKIKPIGCNSL
jgi:hypothetical protein